MSLCKRKIISNAVDFVNGKFGNLVLEKPYVKIWQLMIKLGAGFMLFYLIRLLMLFSLKLHDIYLFEHF